MSPATLCLSTRSLGDSHLWRRGEFLGHKELAFVLGFGIPPDIPTWGNMLTAAGEHMNDLPLLVIAPGLPLTLMIVSLHLVGDGLRDALDPRQL